MADRRALVVGGGIAGLAAAFELAGGPFDHVELRESSERLGGKIATSPFAGLDHVDEAADAFLRRVPSAMSLAADTGIDDLTAPTDATALVWHDGLHPIPGGVVLGLPAAVRPFVTTSLLSWRGKLRAAAEPVLPARPHDDSLGALVRQRFGDEVHERLVDALVGSIYAADTDRWSLATVPQLSQVAEHHRSLLLGARRTRRNAPAAAGPIFAAPATGMATLVEATAAGFVDRGGTIATGRPVERIERDGDAWRVDGERFDEVVLASPAPATAGLVRDVAPDAADALAAVETADVIMLRLHVADLPDRLHGHSGYLVPKPDQRYVTAASFASQKWAAWQPPAGGQILRVSLGRDGLPVMHLDDDAALAATLDETGRHLGLDLQPTEVSITRWPAAFPQYRPGHLERLAELRATLPTGLGLAGASYDGIGIPACIASGRTAARQAIDRAGR
jgi:oxygen-dependent protoporphyrinogen oxidase